MIATLFTLTLAVLACGDTQPTKDAQRKPHPFAPSLPLLTDAEEERIDRIIERFIQYDIGNLRGAEAKKAVADFQKLGPEAIPALIRGLNRAANIEASCPALVIGKKLGGMLSASRDGELLDFARENIGLGVTTSRHMVVIKDLRLACTLRKGQLARVGGIGGAGQPKSLRTMSVAELAEAAGNERGQSLKQLLVELEQRRGDEVITALGSAAATYEDDIRQLARDLLVRHLSRQAPAVIKDKLKDDRAEVRAAAAGIVASKALRLGGELIDMMNDKNSEVREAAHQALVKLNRGTDLGPADKAGDTERETAVEKWRAWWVKQNGR